MAVNSTGESYTQVRLRGAQANHTLVLIDGVEANAAGSGEYLFTGLTLENVARIEVLRGPQSTLYGPNAMGGVISIITKEAEEGQQMGGNIEYGSHSSCATGFYLRQRGAKGGLSLESGDRQTEGEDGSRSGGDTEFNNQQTFSFKGDYALTDTLTLGGGYRRVWQDYGYDATASGAVARPQDYSVDANRSAERNQRFGSLWLNHEGLDGRTSAASPSRA